MAGNRKSLCLVECGNGEIENDEACDDYNRESNDGCSQVKRIKIQCFATNSYQLHEVFTRRRRRRKEQFSSP
jgi:cysteine-rich repeat protein